MEARLGFGELDREVSEVELERLLLSEFSEEELPRRLRRVLRGLRPRLRLGLFLPGAGSFRR